MATKKQQQPDGENRAQALIEERRRRRTEATTVDGTESYPPPGMDLPDGGTVPAQEGETP